VPYFPYVSALRLVKYFIRLISPFAARLYSILFHPSRLSYSITFDQRRRELLWLSNFTFAFAQIGNLGPLPLPAGTANLPDQGGSHYDLQNCKLTHYGAQTISGLTSSDLQPLPTPLISSPQTHFLREIQPSPLSIVRKSRVSLLSDQCLFNLALSIPQ